MLSGQQQLTLKKSAQTSMPSKQKRHNSKKRLKPFSMPSEDVLKEKKVNS